MGKLSSYVALKLLFLLQLVVLLVGGCGGGGGAGDPDGAIAPPAMAQIRLGVIDRLPSGVKINGASVLLTLPAGATIAGDAASAVTVSGEAAGILQKAFVGYQPPTAEKGATLSFLLFLAQPVSTYTGGELVTVQCTLAAGAALRPEDVLVSGFVTNEADATIPEAVIGIIP